MVGRGLFSSTALCRNHGSSSQINIVLCREPVGSRAWGELWLLIRGCLGPSSGEGSLLKGWLSSRMGNVDAGLLKEASNPQDLLCRV